MEFKAPEKHFYVSSVNFQSEIWKSFARLSLRLDNENVHEQNEVAKGEREMEREMEMEIEREREMEIKMCASFVDIDDDDEERW